MPDPSTATPDEFSMDAVVEILTSDLGLDHAFVQHTGGGTATIYAGPKRPHPEYPDQFRHAAIAGPGSYGWGHRASSASFGEFFVGPEDDGETDPVDVAGAGATTERQVALLIAAQARKADPTTPLTFDELEELGFDGTGRSLSPTVARDREETRIYVDASNASNREQIALGVDADARRAINEAAGAAAVEAHRNQSNQ